MANFLSLETMQKTFKNPTILLTGLAVIGGFYLLSKRSQSEQETDPTEPETIADQAIKEPFVGYEAVDVQSYLEPVAQQLGEVMNRLDAVEQIKPVTPIKKKRALPALYNTMVKKYPAKTNPKKSMRLAIWRSNWDQIDPVSISADKQYNKAIDNLERLYTSWINQKKKAI